MGGDSTGMEKDEDKDRRGEKRKKKKNKDEDEKEKETAAPPRTFPRLQIAEASDKVTLSVRRCHHEKQNYQHGRYHQAVKECIHLLLWYPPV